MSPAKNLWTKPALTITAENNLSLIPMVRRRSLTDEEVTIAEVLSAAGYTSAHYGKWHIYGGGSEANGYDEGDGNTSNADAFPLDHLDNPLDVIGMSNRALDFMRRADESNTPFFVQISYYPLHVEENTSSDTVARVQARDLGNVSEGGIRVPFIIRGPGVESDSWSSVPVVGYDFFPTFTEWAGVETDQLPQGIEGGSLTT
jgi:hypothetical protein